MYYISADNKVYVKTEKGFREVKITRDDDGLITIKNLKDTLTVKVKEICILEEVVARYLAVKEVEEQEPQLPTEEDKEDELPTGEDEEPQLPTEEQEPKKPKK